jgi:hypothetical protein
VRPPADHARGSGRAIAAAGLATKRSPPARETCVIDVAHEPRGPRRRSRIGYHRLRWRRPKSPCPRHWSPWIPGLYWF